MYEASVIYGASLTFFFQVEENVEGADNIMNLLYTCHLGELNELQCGFNESEIDNEIDEDESLLPDFPENVK